MFLVILLTEMPKIKTLAYFMNEIKREVRNRPLPDETEDNEENKKTHRGE